MTKVVNTPGGAVAGRSVTLCSRTAARSTIVVEERGDGVDAVVMKWIRSRAAKREEVPQGHHCVGCRTAIAGSTDDELRASGGVFLEGGGWFCGARCERQYRLRFRIQPASTPADGSRAARTPTPAPAPAETEEAPSSRRRSAAEELAEALRARRRLPTNGV
jgi:hypothetical protein